MRASETLADFERDKVDLAIRQGHMTPHAGMVARELASLDLCAVASPSYDQTSANRTSLEDFATDRLIEDGHRHWTRLFSDEGLSASAALSFNQTALAIDAATSGQGIALAPRLLVREAISQGQLLELWQAPQTGDSYYLLYPDARHPARDTVIDWLLALA